MEQYVILITGSTSGIGKEAAYKLASFDTRVIIHGSSSERGEKVCSEISRINPKSKFDFFPADLSSMDAVRQLAVDIKHKYHYIDILINNAATFLHAREITIDGYEKTFAVNHLAHFLLNNLLLDLLKQANKARIINLSSMAYCFANLDFDDLQSERNYDGHDAYAFTKLCNILFTKKLARKLTGTSISTYCLHPGIMNQKLIDTGMDQSGYNTVPGAESIVYLARSERVGESGDFFVENSVYPMSIDKCEEKAKLLWEISEKLTGVTW